jgi:hypothetical protein
MCPGRASLVTAQPIAANFGSMLIHLEKVAEAVRGKPDSA